MSGTSPVIEPRLLLGGLAMPESPRWHDGRLWFSTGAPARSSPSTSTAPARWSARARGARLGGQLAPGRPDAHHRQELMRVEPDGSRVRHADLSHVSPYGWSEMTVDGRGNVYVNSLNFDFADFNDVLASGQAPGMIALVTPDGDVREVASGIAFPNGMVVTPDNRTLDRRRVVHRSAHGLRHRRGRRPLEPSGLGRRTSGRTASASTPTAASGPPAAIMVNDCARIREGGEVLETDRVRPPVLRGDARRARPQDAVHADGRVARHRGDRRRHQAENRAGSRRGRARAGRRLAVVARAPATRASAWPGPRARGRCRARR